MPGTDGEKMSKSYGNTLEVFEEGKELKRSVMRIVTSSTPMGQPLATENDTVLSLYALFATPQELTAMEQAYRQGSVGYGDAKKALLAKIETTFAAARERRRELLAHPDQVEDVIRDGARRAREVARATVDECRQAVGFPATWR